MSWVSLTRSEAAEKEAAEPVTANGRVLPGLRRHYGHISSKKVKGRVKGESLKTHNFSNGSLASLSGHFAANLPFGNSFLQRSSDSL